MPRVYDDECFLSDQYATIVLNSSTTCTSTTKLTIFQVHWDPCVVYIQRDDEDKISYISFRWTT